MVEAKSASFQFESYKISTFSYNEPSQPEATLKLQFNPKGRYHQSTGLFELELEFNAFDNQDFSDKIIHVVCIATFKFQEGLSFAELPSFFYVNSIAIIFPYIRAFVSTLTLQSNTGLVKLGLMNLTNLEKVLKENSVLIDQ